MFSVFQPRRVACRVRNVFKISTRPLFQHLKFENGLSLSGNMSNIQNRRIKIGTHDGIFHCDEVFACYLLKQLPEYSNAEIVRSRDSNILKECDIVVDVGGVFDKATHRYDHHQRDFKETLSRLLPTTKNFSIRLSSAGLIYVHFGEQIIREKSILDDAAVKIIFEKIYENLIQEIDAIDNGVMMCKGESLYRITSDISSRVKRLNPQWNSPQGYDVQEAFDEAMSIVGNEFLDRVSFFTNVWWPAREVVEQSLQNRFNVHKSGQIILLSQRVPWTEHLFDLEESHNYGGIVKFCLFSDGKGAWRVQCVPLKTGSFVCRKFLNPEWHGFRDQQLVTASGIPGSIFCHATGFIGGNLTQEGALQMAVKSLGD